MVLRFLDNSDASALPLRQPAAAPAAAREQSARTRLTLAYEEHAPSLLRYARTIAGNDVDSAADAVQEAFFRYFMSIREGVAIDNDRAWLFSVARNVLADQARRKTVGLDEVTAAVDPRPELERSAGLTVLARRLPELLSARELECVKLRSEGLRYQEIGEALRLQPGTVGALLTRAMDKLRKALKGRR